MAGWSSNPHTEKRHTYSPPTIRVVLFSFEGLNEIRSFSIPLIDEKIDLATNHQSVTHWHYVIILCVGGIKSI